MLSMDEIYLIKELARQGLSARQIAETLKYDRATVRKYLKQVNVAPATIIKVRRSSVMDPYIEGIRDLLLSEKANTSRKHYLTARRIYDMVNEGQIAPGVPSKSISLRTVERTVGLLRREINRKINRQHLKLEHSPGVAQIDFGEVVVGAEGGERRINILVMAFPHSNFRLAYALPAQNFECLAHGLNAMFTEIGRVPAVLRCDNMSTAVAKIIRREDLDKGECNHDALDHPRRLTENFVALMCTYGFEAEFCNPASGNEKGSVENAVGWLRRNFFTPMIRFDGDFVALNEKLTQFCRTKAKEKHYDKGISIEKLFQADMAVMHPLPQEPFDAHSWSTGTVTKDCRVVFETNQYQIDEQPGTKVCIKRYWDRLVFMTEYGEIISEVPRSYDNRKNIIDWPVELKMLSERPSAFNSSSLSKIAPETVLRYLLDLSAPKRRIILRALAQRVQGGGKIGNELKNLETAIRRFGALTVEELVAGYRSINDVATDSIEPLDSLPKELNMQLAPRSLEEVVGTVMGGDYD